MAPPHHVAPAPQTVTMDIGGLMTVLVLLLPFFTLKSAPTDGPHDVSPAQWWHVATRKGHGSSWPGQRTKLIPVATGHVLPGSFTLAVGASGHSMSLWPPWRGHCPYHGLSPSHFHCLWVPVATSHPRGHPTGVAVATGRVMAPSQIPLWTPQGPLCPQGHQGNTVPCPPGHHPDPQGPPKAPRAQLGTWGGHWGWGGGQEGTRGDRREHRGTLGTLSQGHQRPEPLSRWSQCCPGPSQ